MSFDELTQKIYDQTLRFLSFRPRAINEIKCFLKKHHVAQKQTEEIINKLIHLNFLDDEAFIKWWIEQRQNFRQKGLRVIRIELLQKGLSKDLIDKVLEEQKETGKINELELAKKAAQKKLAFYKKLPKNVFYTKMGRYLASRGFDWEVIKTVIDEILKKE